MSEVAPDFEVPDWFRAPSADFQPSTFWFWHAIPSEAEMLRQLADMAATGIGTMMIQPRLALPIEDYLSPAFLAAYRFACQEARRLGLRVTVYDEYNWMSGHGGGRTVAGADHLRERHLFWTSGTVGEEGALSLNISGIASSFYDFLGDVGRHWVYEGGEPLWDEWTIVAAASGPAVENQLDGKSARPAGAPDASGQDSGFADATASVRLSAAGDGGCRIALVEAGLPAGTPVTVFVAARCRSSRMINYLMPEAAERFADVVYAPLLEAAGGTAESFFFDHPYAGFYRWDQHRGDLGNSPLWDDRLPALLGGEAPLALQLLSLTQDVGPPTASLRAGFFAAYQLQLHEAFFGTLSRWAAARGIGFSGHELLTHVGAWGLQEGIGGVDPRSMPGVDYFAIDAYRSHTTVDAADYAPQLAARFGDSVARANGRKRCTIEQYATGREAGLPGLAGQWGLTLEKFRAQAIRHLLFGARQIVLHSYNASDETDDESRFLSPRFDFPPGFNFEPWWEDCPGVLGELSRISAFLEDGKPLRPVALLYPLETIRAGAGSPDCGRHFGWWAEALAQAGIGYDIIDEAGLERLGHALGSSSTAGSKTAESRRETPATGLPTATGAKASATYETLILPAVDTLASVGSAEHIAAFVAAGGRLLASGVLPSQSRAEGEDAQCAGIFAALAALPAVQHLPTASKPTIDDAVAALPRPQPDIRFDAGPGWNTVLRDDDAWKIALFNDADTTRRVTITLGGPVGLVRRWNPETGTVAAIDVHAGRGGFEIDVGAQQVFCLSVRDGEAIRRARPKPDTSLAPPPAVVLAEGWTFQIRGSREAAVAIDVTRGWEVQGFAGLAGTGIYRCDAVLPQLAAGLAWTLALPGLCETAECFVNGTFVGRHVAGEAAFPLTGISGNAHLVLHVRNTAANRYYPGQPFWNGTYEPSGITATPRLEARAL